jgi:hypothetical protein
MNDEAIVEKDGSTRIWSARKCLALFVAGDGQASGLVGGSVIERDRQVRPLALIPYVPTGKICLGMLLEERRGRVCQCSRLLRIDGTNDESEGRFDRVASRFEDADLSTAGLWIAGLS